MKTINRTSAAVVVCMLAAATSTWAGISGSAHDFRGEAWNTGTGTNASEICAPCHTPHNAQSTQLIPLWNHAATAETFQMYTNDSGTLDGAVDTGGPSGSSKVCFSCHDGSIALNAYGANATNNAGTKMTGTALLGTDLRNDHPISIEYNEVADDGLNPDTDSAYGSGTIADYLENDKVQCSSCHDVHGGGTGAKLLYIPNAGSALCLTCHNK